MITIEEVTKTSMDLLEELHTSHVDFDWSSHIAPQSEHLASVLTQTA